MSTLTATDSAISITVNVHEAKTNLSRLLEQALAGDDVIIMRSGRHLVRLVPVDMAPQRRVVGSARGEFTVPDDFNDTLPEEILQEFGA